MFTCKPFIIFVLYLHVWIWDASCHVQKGKSMPFAGSFVENVPVPLGFVAVLSPVKRDWRLLGCRPCFPVKKVNSDGRLWNLRSLGSLCFTEITFQHGALRESLRGLKHLLLNMLSGAEDHPAGRPYLVLPGSRGLNLPTSLETLVLGPVNNNTVTSFVGLSHFPILLFLFCLFLRIL